MAVQPTQSWWSQFGQDYGPGLLSGALELGGGLYRDKRAQSSNEALLRRAQGPNYQQQQQMAGQALNLAQNLDPKAAAAERFRAQQELMHPGEEAAQQKLAINDLSAASKITIPNAEAQAKRRNQAVDTAAE